MTVILSPKYQVVIPKFLREKLKLKPGQKMQVFEIDGRIQILPFQKPAQLRGFLQGLDTRIDRELDRS